MRPPNEDAEVNDDQVEVQPSHADALIMFGLTGDLGGKKLFPALYELAAADKLGIPVIGVGRSEYSDDEIRSMLREALDGFSPADGAGIDDAVVDSIDVRYLSGDSTESATYDALVDMLDGVDCPVVYAALPPDLFGDVARGIADSSFPAETRLVVEKPFGDGSDAARELHAEISGALGTHALFVVDHFLAKSAVENMLTVRTANSLIDSNMCAQYVDSVEIDMTETGSVEGRGSFYEGVGAVDDVLQNHLIQVLASLLMDAPSDRTPAAMESSRLEFLRSVRAIDPDGIVLGQYAGYRDHDDVSDDSMVETYVEVAVVVDNDRWRGVPITVRSGKQLHEDSTVATIHLTDRATGPDSVHNAIRFVIKPEPRVEIELGVLDPESHEPVPVVAELHTAEDHGPLGDYATMLANALTGDHHHFAQVDDIVEAWRIVANVSLDSTELVIYESGSNGPPRLRDRD